MIVEQEDMLVQLSLRKKWNEMVLKKVRNCLKISPFEQPLFDMLYFDPNTAPSISLASYLAPLKMK